MKKLFVAFF